MVIKNNLIKTCRQIIKILLLCFLLIFFYFSLTMTLAQYNNFTADSDGLTIVNKLSNHSSVKAYNKNFWLEEEEKAREAVEEEGDSLEANYYLAVTKANLGEIKKTDEMLSEFSDIDSDEFNEKIEPVIADNTFALDELVILNFRAFNYIIKEKYEQATQIFTEIIELDDENIWPRNFKAASYIEDSQIEEAQDVLYKNLEIAEDDYTYFLLGYTYYEKGRNLQAINYMRRAGQVFSDFIF